MKFICGLVAVYLFFARALANTETVRFIYNSNDYNDIINSSWENISDRLSENNSTLLKWFQPSPRGSESVTWIALDGIDGGSYEVRVCWPASSPSCFNLDYEKGYLRISYKTDYYSHLNELMDNPLPVQCEIILNRLVLNALPRDIVETIGLTIVGGVLAYYYLSGLPFSHGLI